ncbi:winged helix-turn-helix transcriptional regulator [Flagellimonas ruestringensis]|uniref:winged helix-turn-helix transcriptional regulator n=1 Tax=Flagellimonas ruestringensis TaxID=111501 RepID=UPI0011D19911
MHISELKSLEVNGLVSHNVLVDEFPVVVEYVLTNYSDSLLEILDTRKGLLKKSRWQT